MKIIIAGSRKFKDYNILENRCKEIIVEIQYKNSLSLEEIEIIFSSDNERGNASFIKRFCEKYNIKAKEFRIDWKDMNPPVYHKFNDYFGEYNSLAFQKTNIQMVEYVRKNGGGVLITFDFKEKDTKDIVKKASVAGIEIYEINIKG